MEDITGLGKLADSKLVNDAYADGLSETTREAGKLLTDVTKAFRLFLAPIQLLSVAQDRLARFCDRIRDAVPMERQIEAAPSIAGPVLLELRYMEDENPITELYLNLLKRAIDAERVDEAHPAFVKIISQLSPNEALILHFLRTEEIDCIEFRDHRTPDHPLVAVHQSNYPIPELQKSNRLSMYLEHLEFLNLVHYGVGTDIGEKTITPPSNCWAMGSKAKLTQFGRLFVNACEP